MQKSSRFSLPWPQRWQLSLFEKVILVNSLMLLGEALAGLWVTSHHLEAQHYLIDTGFIVGATLLTLFINVLLLRMSFQPLFGLLSTIREVSNGNTSARATLSNADTEITELATAFNSMLDRLETLYRAQTSLILQAQEDERRRIGLELHDEAGQNLTALLIHAEVLQQALPTFSQVGAELKTYLESGLQQLTRLTQHTLETIRVLAQQLRPSVLDDLGLLPAFRWLVEDSAQRLHLPVELHVSGLKESGQDAMHPLPDAFETALFRIAQESLTNIARHAQAQQAQIFLVQEDACIRLQILDNGCGYTPSQKRNGLGLFGMRERASQLGGTFTIAPRVGGGGTQVQALLPLPERNKTTEPVLASLPKERAYVR